jgi:hypothetical protein
MKLKLSIRRTARLGGQIGVGVRYLLPAATIVGVASVALESELQLDLLLWQVRVRHTTAPQRNWKVW